MMKQYNDGPYAAARRLVALEKEKILARAFKEAAPGTLQGVLAELKRDGVIDHPQYHGLFFMDPRRCAYEVGIIQGLAAEGAIVAGNIPLFEEVQAAGSQYFFENFSPLAQLNRG